MQTQFSPTLQKR